MTDIKKYKLSISERYISRYSLLSHLNKAYEIGKESPSEIYYDVKIIIQKHKPWWRVW